MRVALKRLTAGRSSPPFPTGASPSTRVAIVAPSYGRTAKPASHAWRCPSPRNDSAARSQKSSTLQVRSGRSSTSWNVVSSLRPMR